MRIKSYFSKSVDEAMALARAELGADALLLNTRRFTQAGRPAGYEVVIGFADAPPPPEPVVLAPPAPSAVIATDQTLAAELDKLRKQMDEIQALLTRPVHQEPIHQASSELPAQPPLGSLLPLGRPHPAKPSSTEMARVRERLLASDIDASMTNDIIERLEATLAMDAFFPENGEGSGAPEAPGSARIEKLLREELERRVNMRPVLGVDGGAFGAIAAVVGPAGSGKTTSLAKLAMAASKQWPVRFLSLDMSPDALRTPAALAGNPRIKFSTVSSLDQLPKMLIEARKKECVLIDTPGFAVADQASAELLARVFSECPEIDIHLVVPAYIKSADLRRAVRRYDVFHPTKLLVTKLDEAQTLGTAYSEAARSGLALSFLTNGPRVPEDIMPATSEGLLVRTPEPALAKAQHAA